MPSSPPPPDAARIAFCLMVHDNPAKVRDFVSLIRKFGHDVFIHLDTSVQGAVREKYISTVAECGEGVKFVPAVKCEWGSWNLVQGVLNLLVDVVGSNNPYTHVQLLSGADLPTQDLGHFGQFLMRNPGVDFIETVDIAISKWAVHGPERERFLYYFPFSWRRQRGLFDFAFSLQKLFGVKRRIPCAITPRLGSQWWTLRLATCRKILDFLQDQPAVTSYFKYTLIPDECFFQSLVPHLVGPLEIVPRSLTLYKFTQYGKPFVFYDDHHDWLTQEPFFFVRKVSPTSKELQRRLFERAAGGPPPSWTDSRAGFRSWELLAESERAYRFEDPMVGHIGSSSHQAFKSPDGACLVLVCADAAEQFRLARLLEEGVGVHGVDPYQLPPYRTLAGKSVPLLSSFLANELNLPNVATCIVTSVSAYGEICAGLRDLSDIKLHTAVFESQGRKIDHTGLNRQCRLAWSKTVSLVPEPMTAPGPFPVFHEGAEEQILEWIRLTARECAPIPN